MFRFLLLSLALPLLMASCRKGTPDITTPDQNPHLVQFEQYLPAQDLVVNMDTIAPPQVMAIQPTAVRVKKEFIPHNNTYKRLEKPLSTLIRERSIAGDSLPKPRYTPVQGKKTATQWPEWFEEWRRVLSLYKTQWPSGQHYKRPGRRPTGKDMDRYEPGLMPVGWFSTSLVFDLLNTP